ncbi:MAG: bifunctional oligoribonuclease/PAP phosphatase NrnA [Firmicutes bacterium]|nr:bifunctional oligoribonuclease/PAP phosphatase NrnA [Bacillota bacterium]
MRGSLEEVAEALVSYESLFITWHIDPDPDSVGSGLALKQMLELMGRDAVCISPDPLGGSFDFLPGIEDCLIFSKDLALDYQAVVVLDAEISRCGGFSDVLESGDLPIINIDHHKTNLGQGEAYWVDPQAAACGEMIYRLSKFWGLSLESDIATNLYAAISGDTGTFRYTNTTACTLKAAGELVRAGADPGLIAINLYEKRSKQDVLLQAQALDTLEISTEGSVAHITITQQMLAGRSWVGQHSEDIIQFPRMIDTVEVAVLFRELDDTKTKVSFRSRAYTDVSAIAAKFGGGGHARAAGCTVDMSLALAKEEIIKAVVETLETDLGQK